MITFPAGRAVPEEVMTNRSARGPSPCVRGEPCTAAFVDLDKDGQEDIVLAGDNYASVYAQRLGHWENIGNLQNYCASDRDALARGAFKVVAADK